MLVAECAGAGRWEVVDDLVTVARISEGLDATGALSEAPIRRAEAVLAAYAARAAELGVSRVVATGTAPFRRARNGAQVATRLAAVVGASVDVVSGDHEAALSLLATRRSFPGLDDLLVVDIGGASTELIRLRPSGAPEVVSLDVGSVRLTERCVSGAPLSDGDRAALVAALESALGDPLVDAIVGGGTPTLVGVAGTVTTLVTVAAAMPNYDAAVVHGFDLALSEVERVFALLMGRSVAEREALPGMSPGRADVLPAGALLLAAVMRRAGVDRVLVSDRGTRWGRLYEAFACGEA